MIGLIQRVRSAAVDVAGERVGEIDQGILLLLGVERDDTPEKAEKLLKKILTYRIFADAAGRMNRSLLDIEGELLVVSQFTLAADTGSGTRPGFSCAGAPTLAERLYEQVLTSAAQQVKVASGRFGADMQVSLVNDGPVTFHFKV